MCNNNYDYSPDNVYILTFISQTNETAKVFPVAKYEINME